MAGGHLEKTGGKTGTTSAGTRPGEAGDVRRFCERGFSSAGKVMIPSGHTGVRPDAGNGRVREQSAGRTRLPCDEVDIDEEGQEQLEFCRLFLGADHVPGCRQGEIVTDLFRSFQQVQRQGPELLRFGIRPVGSAQPFPEPSRMPSQPTDPVVLGSIFCKAIDPEPERAR